MLEIANEIRDLLYEKQKELDLSFIEEEHIYFMKDDDGVVKNNFPSVSKVMKLFYKPFDSEAKAEKLAYGDYHKKQKILNEWSQKGEYSINIGSRTHYHLEKHLVDLYGTYKDVRQPIFECDDLQIAESNLMINAGKEYLNLMMNQRNAVLIDTEIVLGHPNLGYTGQPDKVWLMENNNKEHGIVITDWKTNKPENFVPQIFTDNMLTPFQEYKNTALSHYYTQLPLYAKLLLKMLEGTKYGNIKFFGGVVVLLKRDGTFVEYKIPNFIKNTILTMDIKSLLIKK